MTYKGGNQHYLRLMNKKYDSLYIKTDLQLNKGLQ